MEISYLSYFYTIIITTTIIAIYISIITIANTKIKNKKYLEGPIRDKELFAAAMNARASPIVPERDAFRQASIERLVAIVAPWRVSQKENLAGASDKFLQLFRVHGSHVFPIGGHFIVVDAKLNVWKHVEHALVDVSLMEGGIEQVKDSGVFPKEIVKPFAGYCEPDKDVDILNPLDVAKDVRHNQRHVIVLARVLQAKHFLYVLLEFGV